MTKPLPSEKHTKLREELDKIRDRINALKLHDPSRMDLIKVHKNILEVWNKLDNEMIICRRRNCETFTYTELSETISKRLAIMDKEIFWRGLH
jgi:phosphoglycerate-specific signal transduction histidine kinase